MNKKLNTFLFIVVATLANLASMFVIAIIPLLIFWNFLAKELDPIISAAIGIVILMVAVLVAFIIYNRVLKIFIAKVNLDKYFDPLFVKTIKKK